MNCRIDMIDIDCLCKNNFKIMKYDIIVSRKIILHRKNTNQTKYAPKAFGGRALTVTAGELL